MILILINCLIALFLLDVMAGFVVVGDGLFPDDLADLPDELHHGYLSQGHLDQVPEFHEAGDLLLHVTSPKGQHFGVPDAPVLGRKSFGLADGLVD